MPKVSIIIPTLNSQGTIEDCINSLKQLQDLDIEILVKDGGSSDSTVDLVQRAKADFGCQFVIIERPDEGIYDAMNQAIDEATGDYLYFLGSDDAVLSGFRRAVRFLRRDDTLYYGNAIFPKSFREHAGYFVGSRLFTQNISHQAIFYPRSILASQPYDVNFPILADWKMNIDLYYKTRLRFQFIPVAVALYREGGTSAQVRDLRFESFLEEARVNYPKKTSWSQEKMNRLQTLRGVLEGLFHGYFW